MKRRLRLQTTNITVLFPRATIDWCALGAVFSIWWEWEKILARFGCYQSDQCKVSSYRNECTAVLCSCSLYLWVERKPSRHQAVRVDMRSVIAVTKVANPPAVISSNSFISVHTARYSRSYCIVSLSGLVALTTALFNMSSCFLSHLMWGQFEAIQSRAFPSWG